MSSSISPVNAAYFLAHGHFRKDDRKLQSVGAQCASFIDTLDANVILGCQFLSSQRGCLEIQEVL